MKAFRGACIFSAIWIGLPTAANTEHWVSVFKSERTDSVWWVDTDSIYRDGDLAMIRMKFNNDVTEIRTFDCSRNTLLGHRPMTLPQITAEQITGIPLLPNTKEKAMFDKACKRWWEFWK